MAEGLLDDLETGAVLSEPAREGMAEHVRVDRAADDRDHRAVDQMPDASAMERLTRAPETVTPRGVRVHEHERHRRRDSDQGPPHERRPYLGEVLAQDRREPRDDEQLAVLAALAVHDAKATSLQVYVGELERGQLGGGR